MGQRASQLCLNHRTNKWKGKTNITPWCVVVIKTKFEVWTEACVGVFNASGAKRSPGPALRGFQNIRLLGEKNNLLHDAQVNPETWKLKYIKGFRKGLTWNRHKRNGAETLTAGSVVFHGEGRKTEANQKSSFIRKTSQSVW